MLEKLLLLFFLSFLSFDIKNIGVFTEDISGNTFFLISAMNKDLVLMPKDSRPGWEYVILFDKTKSDSQKWKFTNEGTFYSIKNSGTELNFHYGEAIKDAHVDQNYYDRSDYYKWILKEVDNKSGKYMLEAFRKDENGNPVYATASKNSRGTEIFLRSPDKSNPDTQIWILEKTSNVETSEFTREKANEIGRAYLNKYYIDTKQSDGSIKKSIGGGFWVGAEMCEMMLDGYETLGDNTYKVAFETSYQDELDNVGNRYPYWTGMTETDWKDNPFNDDIMWLVLASVRAYFLIGNGNKGFTNYLEYAIKNFHTVMERGTKSDGTMRWSHEDGRGDGTTSCINGPSVVAACYLAKATGEKSYYETAKKIHSAQRKTMFNSETGQVYDSPTNNWPSCYNQGTWIGSCVMLYNYYQDHEYLVDAVLAMEYLIKNDGHFSDKYGVLKQEDATTGDDLPTFRSILMRYVRMFIIEFADKMDMTPYINWFQKNAKVIYNNKNIYGLIQTPFNHATENGMDYGLAGMSGGVSLALNMIFNDKMEKDAYSRIEAEDFNYIKGVICENTPDENGYKQIGGSYEGTFTGYSNVVFGEEGATSADFRISTIGDNGTIEIHIDNPEGKTIGIVDLPNTGAWENFKTVSCKIEKTTGNHKIFLVYRKGKSDFIVNLNWFKFNQE